MDKYTPGKLVWVRMRSYPWWPAEIVSPDEPGLSEEVLEEKKPNTVLVRFFGEGNFCWSPQKNICSFRRNYDSHSKNNSRGLRSAIKEAVELEQEKGTSDIESEGETKKAEGSKRKRETAKSEDASANGEGTEPPKKKRGRPRKSESTETTPKKRKQPDSEKKKGASKKPKEEKQASKKDEKKKDKAEDDKDEERRKKRLERKQERREERRKKRKEEQAKDDSTKSKEGTAASPKKDPSLVMQSLNKHLRKAYAEHNEARILQVLKKLKRSTGTVTLKNLHESGLGKTVKRVTKHNNSEIRDMANELLSFYMALMDEAIKTGDISQLNLAKAEEKKREAEAEAAAKKDSPPADGEPTVQQNGDSADKDVTMADAATEDTTGGGGEEKAVAQPAPQQQEPKEKEEAEEEEEKKSDSAQSLPPAAAPEPSDEGQKAEEKEQKDNATVEQPSGEGEKVNEAH